MSLRHLSSSIWPSSRTQSLGGLPSWPFMTFFAGKKKCGPPSVLDLQTDSFRSPQLNQQRGPRWVGWRRRCRRGGGSCRWGRARVEGGEADVRQPENPTPRYPHRQVHHVLLLLLASVSPLSPNFITPPPILVAQMVKNLPAMQETRPPSLGWEDPLEKEMATHLPASILAWRIPWTEEPGGGLQSLGS